MSNSSILTASVRDHFLEVIEETLDLHQLSANVYLKDYLVDLLCDFAWTSADIVDQPLGPVYVRAQTGLPRKQLKVFKQVGDQALYVAGFFQERLSRKRLDPNYYSEIGGSAYLRLSELVRKREEREDSEALADTYAQLSADFRHFVRVFHEVKQYGQASTEDLGACFKRWKQTGSLSARRQLEMAGVNLGPFSKRGNN